MKKKHFLLLCIYLWTFSIFSQPTDYKIHLSAVATPATCQGNGEIHCTITYNPEIQIEQVRYFYIPLSGIDSIMETTLPDITHLRPGDYKIKVSALCRTGLAGEEANIIISDSIEQLTVETNYTIPYSWMLYNIYAFSAPYGIVPSTSCAPTGKLQVKIQHGTFPYHLDIWKITPTDTLFYRAVTFDSNMYQGSDSLRYNYKDYYTIDSLEVGTYQILCSDGCGYFMPTLKATVPKVKYYDSKDFHLLRNSSGIPESRNIITFKELNDEISHLGYNDDYYRQTMHGERVMNYRFINPTMREGVYDTTAWKRMPAFEGSTFLYDTLAQLNDYGDVWARDILLQLQPECQDTLFSYPFTIYSHGYNYSYLGTQRINYHAIGGHIDYCGYYDDDIQYDLINSNLTVYHARESCQEYPDSIGCTSYYGYTKSGGITILPMSMMYHSYITFPLKHNIINISQDTLVSKKIMDGNDYPWEYHLLEGMDFQITEKSDIAFACDCSRERVAESIASISKDDIQEMIDDGKPVEVRCQFCNTTYEFSVDDLKEML